MQISLTLELEGQSGIKRAAYLLKRTGQPDRDMRTVSILRDVLIYEKARIGKYKWYNENSLKA